MAFRDFAARYAISTSVELDAQRRPALDADDGEAIAATFPAVDLVAGDDEPPAAANGTADAADADAPPLPAALRLGTGTLYVTTRRVVWVADDAPDGAPAGSASPPQAVALTYRQVVMHAVATDAASFSRPCVYLQLDAGDEGMMEEEEDEAPGPAPELRMVPADASQVEPLFQALCDNSALNPDTDAEEQQGNELLTLARLEAMVTGQAGAAGGGGAVAEEEEEEEQGAAAR